MKKIAGIIFSFCFVLVGKAQTPDVWDGTSDTTWYNTTDTLFQLTTAEQLAGLAMMVNNGNSFQGKTIELMNDLDLGGELETPLNWMPIGYIYTDTLSFSGIFDGNNFTVENLYLQELVEDTLNMGLFGCINGAAISNVIINNVFFNFNQDLKYISSRGVLVGDCSYSQIVNCHIKAIINCYDCAGIAGEMSYSSVSYCSFNGKIEGNGNGIAGIAGIVRNSNVNNCISHAIIKGNKYVGGIAAISSYSNIFNNIFMGECEVSYTYSGGIIGSSFHDTIENNFAITSQVGYGVSEIEILSIGGLIGDLYNSNINNCYITGGKISSLGFSGGIVGYGDIIDIENCYASTYMSEKGEYSGNIAGVLNNSTINNTFMDNNIGAFDGVGYNYMGNGEVIGFFTEEMTSGNSFGLQDSVGIYPAKWVYEEGLYPQLDVFVNHPDTIFRQASLLSVIPIFLGEQSANQIRNDFKVSTLYGVSWTSSAEDIIRIEGENATVTRIDQDTMIVLTVTLNDLQKEFYVKVKQGNDIKEVHTNKINLYPNPSNYQFTLDNGQELMKEVSLYDVMGRKVKHLPVHAPSTTVDVSDLPNGIYVVKISTASGVLVRKVQVVK
ncbi:MAG: T9SS type A sorting domain-containing protein [Bacteroidales bacterium]|nr:T9SS type A sorting domain-containing protein [Bacteroidales bacterium]